MGKKACVFTTIVLTGKINLRRTVIMEEKWTEERGMSEMCSMYPVPCIPQETVLRNVRLARAYVPFQKLCSLYPPIEALKRGTAFPELYSPYRGVDKYYRPPRD